MDSRITTVPVLAVAIIVDAYLLVDGGGLFGAMWGAYSNVLVFYMVLDAMFLILAWSSSIPFYDVDVWTAIIVFVPTFLVGAVAFSSLFRLVPFTIALPNVELDFVFQIFTVAFSEEFIFRGVLLRFTGPVIQGIAFGLFHLVAYTGITGLDIPAVLIAMVLGIAFGYIVKYFESLGMQGVGLTITWALHSAWNISILTGIFAPSVVPGVMFMHPSTTTWMIT